VADWSVYLLRCGDGTLYTGIATDVERRFAEHVAGKGARYTRGRGPLTLLGARAVGNRSEALREEARIKTLDRARKLAAVPDYTPAGNSAPGSGTPSASSGSAEAEDTAGSGSGA
jgi:putative endonuclease